MRCLTYVVAEGRQNVRACDYLRSALGYSARMMTALRKELGLLTVNGKPCPVVERVSSGDVLCVNLPDDRMNSVPNPSLRAPAAYEDEDVVVFDKPAGMPVHESKRHQENTLANLFAARCLQSGESSVFRAVNRLDKNTSGLVVVAKNRHIAGGLCAQVEKEYTAILCGVLPDDEGVIDAPIRRLAPETQIRVVSADGQRAVTRYRTLFRGEGYSVAQVVLETGRTHQIRVHFSHIGFPLAGDEMYGGDLRDIPRHALHCGLVRFENTVTGQPVLVRSPVSGDMRALMERISGAAGSDA